MDLAIIIVSYNTRELLRDCLRSVYESLAGSPGLDAAVLVVDNASADGSAALVRDEFPQARLFALDENLGFAGGNNWALRTLGFGEPQAASDKLQAASREVQGSGYSAQGSSDTDHASRIIAQHPERSRGTPHGSRLTDHAPRYILLLNSDTVVLGDALARMVAFLDETPQAGGCGARLSYADGSFQHSAFRFPGLTQIAFDFFRPPGRLNRPLLDSRWNGRYSRRLYEAGRPFPIDFVLGATLMLRGEAIRQVGLLDEGYFMYCEEMDWQRRFRAAGWPMFCLPTARIAHVGGASTSQFRGAMVEALWRSRFRYFRRYHGRLFNRLAAWLVRLGLRAEARRARRQAPPDLAERLAAFASVERMSKSANGQISK